MYSDDEGSAGEEFLPDLPEDFALEGFIEISEGHIPAENEVKRAFRRRRPDILLEKFHRSPNCFFHAVSVSRFYEPCIQPFPGKFSHAARRITSFLRPLDHAPVGIGRNDLHRHISKCALEGSGPEERQGIGLFSRSASNAPAPQFPVSPGARESCKLRKDITFQKLKYFPVPGKTGNRDMAERVEDGPLGRRAPEIGPVR